MDVVESTANRAVRRAHDSLTCRGEQVDIDQVVIRVLPGGRVDRKNAARYLNRTAKTLAEWSRLGRGPRPFLVGGRVFYDWPEVQAYGAAA
jgi:hypothetical protein